MCRVEQLAEERSHVWQRNAPVDLVKLQTTVKVQKSRSVLRSCSKIRPKMVHPRMRNQQIDLEFFWLSNFTKEIYWALGRAADPGSAGFLSIVLRDPDPDLKHSSYVEFNPTCYSGLDLLTSWTFLHVLIRPWMYRQVETKHVNCVQKRVWIHIKLKCAIQIRQKNGWIRNNGASEQTVIPVNTIGALKDIGVSNLKVLSSEF